MKRLLICFISALILCLSGIEISAAEYEVDEGEGGFNYDYNDYLPDEIKDILNNGNVEEADDVKFSQVLSNVIGYLTISMDKHKDSLIQILAIIFLAGLTCVASDSSKYLSSISYLFVVIVSLQFVLIFYSLYGEIDTTIKRFTELINISYPSLLTVSLFAGAVHSAATISTSFLVILGLLENFVSEIGAKALVIAFVLLIFEKSSSFAGKTKIVSSFKKYTVSVVTFISSLFLTVITTQSVISSRADNLTMRSVKFATSNFIPIIGSAVGESLKTVSSGIDYMKTSLGTGILFGLLFTVLPILCELFVLKLISSFWGLSASIVGVDALKDLFDGFVSVLDIAIVIIIYTAILSLVPIFAFIILAFV